MPRMDKLSPHRTTWTQDGDNIVVCYVRTNIVKADADSVTLNSGGWRTVTTKRKMTQASNQFGLGFTVFQHNGDWFVCRLGRSPEGYASTGKAHGAIVIPYRDGMTFPRGMVRPEA